MSMRKVFVIKNSAGQNVSAFYPNCGDKQRFLRYMESQYITFSNKTEAKDWLKYVQSHGVGKNLVIKERVSLR